MGWRGCESGGRVSIFMARLAVVIAVRDSEKGAGHRTIFLNGTVVQYQYVPFSLECGTAKRARDIAQFCFFNGTVVLLRSSTYLFLLNVAGIILAKRAKDRRRTQTGHGRSIRFPNQVFQFRKTYSNFLNICLAALRAVLRDHRKIVLFQVFHVLIVIFQ